MPRAVEPVSGGPAYANWFACLSLAAAVQCAQRPPRRAGEEIEAATSSLGSNEPSIASASNTTLATTPSDACTSEGENVTTESIGAGLAAVIDAWPTLPATIKVAIVA